MIKILKVLTIFLILTIGTACSTLPTTVAFCHPERPALEDITREEQIAIKNISSDLLRKVGENDLKLKSYSISLEDEGTLINEANGVDCEGI